MAKTWSIINGEELGKQICEILEIDPHKTSRIVIDIAANDFVKIYVDMVGDYKLLDVKWCELEAKIEESEEE